MFTVFPREGGLRILRSVLAVFMARVLELFWVSVHRYRAGKPCPQTWLPSLVAYVVVLGQPRIKSQQPPQPSQVVCTAALRTCFEAVL